MPTIPVTDEELHEIVDCLNARVIQYRYEKPILNDAKSIERTSAWVDRYAAKVDTIVNKINGVTDSLGDDYDPHHMKLVMRWNKRLDELQAENKRLKEQLENRKSA